ncbi:MAG: 4-hydroxy-3-methylbut-2-enyl diphosphate reductase [Bacteroidia bacterium]|nr:4-hydroxy-3-methylbut-2-enyl diphosphate reductase [Bacteroidia bacterium]
MKVTIDGHSGFCFGVVYAIQTAEDELDQHGHLYCLGDIVHNGEEVERLRAKGLEIIDHERLKTLKDCKVLIRAHGEPPSTYALAIRNNIELIDASCPVVLKLQHRVKSSFESIPGQDGQIVIYGQPGHAEVNGLVGQTDGKAIVVFSEEDLDKIDYSRPVHFFSQTTKSTLGFEKMERLIQERILQFKGSLEEGDFVSNDTLCRQVSNREPQLKRFAAAQDVIVFVSGKKSSNGKALYSVCKASNPHSYFISNPSELDPSWFEGHENVGIAGATSTPMWLMEQVADAIRKSTLATSR